ncbi:MAG: translation initiation factor IF-2 [Clostridia bacterium]|nr:translation initiation factor IF-2 [Clostridia bacterium]
MAKGIKISDLSKDFSMKSKDIIEEFKTVDIEKTTGGTVSDEEFAVFMQHITSTHQIYDLEAYTTGKITIKIADKTEKKAAPKAEEKKPEPKAESKAEVKKPEPKAAPKAEEKKPESKAEPKAEVKKPEPKAEEKKPEPKPEIQKRPEGQRPQRPDGQRPQRPDGQRPQFDRNGQRDGQRPQFDRNNNNNQKRNDGQGYQGNKYGARPSDDPFAKRRENMNREANGQRKGAEGFGKPQQKPQQPPVQKAAPIIAETQRKDSGLRPAQQAQQAQLERKQKLEAQQAQQKAQPKKEEKKAQKQQFKTITPSIDRSNVKGGVNLDGYTRDENQGKRIIDTRTTHVDLSKYDERYNDQYYAILNGTDQKSSKTKLKKQDNKGQNQKTAKDKERAAQEKIKRMEQERARQKQLEITVPDEITVSELAIRLKKTSAEVIKKLMMMGEMKGLNDVIDFGTAEIIADEFGAKVTKEVVVTIEEKLFTEAEDNDEDLVERAPVVCVMGHVDHGKTSILDAIRHTNVTRGEAGGITQAIGAYRVKAQGKDITFLDTPGHEAFTAMRMRGAKSTDIAILVVAADDGVMPQTVEAINHAKAAGIDIVVAINKMDKPTANPDNILNQLTTYELVPEAWGGDVITVPVSAHTGMGIEDLLESVLLVAEMKELRANPQKRAKGIVIESKLDKGRGSVATVLVQNGTLHQGDYVIVGTATGRVRAMIDDKGKTVKAAGPSVPVEIIGLDDVPQAGDELNAVEDERMARNLAEQRREKQRQEILNANARVNLDDLFSMISEGVQTLNIIVKADVAGSAEAVKASLLKLSNDEVKVSVIHTAVGGITESDVMLAAASGAIIVGFSVRPDRNALESAERNNVDIRTHRIIYEIIDEVEAAMKGMLAPEFKEVLQGHAEVRQTIKVPGVGIIAGCYIQDGKITRQSSIRIVRDGVVIFEDKISSLRRFKDDVKEVNEGYECGVGIEKFNDIREGDVLESFIMEEVKR